MDFREEPEELSVTEMLDSLTLSFNDWNHEGVAGLLIKELTPLLQNTQAYHSTIMKRSGLLNYLIEDEQVPEQYAQTLLFFKIVNLISKNQVNEAIHRLDKLDDPDYRLTCNTDTYYQLLKLKVNILMSKSEFRTAYDYLLRIQLLYFSDPDFTLLSSHKEINKNWGIKIAVAAHFCGLDESYSRFEALINTPEYDFQLQLSNINIFIVFGYECMRQNKFQEAAAVFGELHAFMQAYPNFNDIDLSLEVSAMKIIAKKLGSIDFAQGELENYIGLCSSPGALDSQKNLALKSKVQKLCQNDYFARGPNFTPGFNGIDQKADKPGVREPAFLPKVKSGAAFSL